MSHGSLQKENTSYKDGKSIKSGQNLATGSTLRGNGVLSLGQRTPRLPFGNWRTRFSGRMNDFNVWNEVLTPNEILGMAKCNGSAAGNVKSWSDFKLKSRRFKVTTNVCPEKC